MNIENFRGEITTCAQSNNVLFYCWGNHLPNGCSMDHKQIDSDTYGVQLYVSDSDGFAKYEKIRSELTAIFENNDFYLADEFPLDKKRGWFMELRFVVKGSPTHNKRQQQAIPVVISSIGTQITGDVMINSDNAVIGNNNNIKQESTKSDSDKGWLKKELVIGVITIVAAVIAGFILYKLGWI